MRKSRHRRHRHSNAVRFHALLDTLATRQIDWLNLTKTGLVASLALWLAWQVIINSAPTPEIPAHIDTAPGAWPTDPDTLVRIAAQGLEDSSLDLSTVEALAREALVAKPIAVEPLGLLAIVAERRGDPAKAELLMRAAEARTLRSPLIEVWFFNRALASRNIPEALVHGDLLLRGAPPDVRDEARGELLRLAGDEANAGVFASALAKNPPWRAEFLGMFLRAPSNTATASPALLSALSRTTEPATLDEIGAYLFALVAQGEFERAYDIWLDAMSPAPTEQVAYAYNGDFEQPIHKNPFDWILADKRVADVGISDAPGRGRTLKVEFAGRQISASLARKLMVLPPGDYVLSTQVKADRIDNERGIWWRLTCADGDKQYLGATERIFGTVAWRDISASFAVPDTCHAEWLTLDLAARAAREQEVSGTIWIDDVAVVRSESEATQ
jgi:hypothetical protein